MYRKYNQLLVWNTIRRCTDVCHARLKICSQLVLVKKHCRHGRYRKCNNLIKCLYEHCSLEVPSSIGHAVSGARAALCVLPWFYTASWSLKSRDGHSRPRCCPTYWLDAHAMMVRIYPVAHLRRFRWRFHCHPPIPSSAVVDIRLENKLEAREPRASRASLLSSLR
jgi:hypothetical protein